jgi:ectoine hydroxylase-related dioxygenase (phytanoyl-CoA dioxygenase family)
MSIKATQPTVTLTPDQIHSFQENGFLAIDAITTQGEVVKLREAYDRLFENKAGREVGDQFDLAGTDEEGREARLPQILNPSKYAPELVDTLYRANARAIAEQLLGPGVVERGEHAIFKPAHHGSVTPWHQDEAYLAPDKEYTMVSFWMPLQEATIENGCMYFVPGSHRLEVQPHHCINNDPRIHGLEMDEEIDLSKAVACPLPPGGATLHLSRTIHYAGPNRSAIPRRAYTLNFGLEPKKRAVSRDFYWNDQKITARKQRALAANNTDEPGV